tara:strand:+ start:950 stop:1147 length:198 start_codon:yes stop_codon:yes gene_type:complete
MTKELLYLYNRSYTEYNIESGGWKWILSMMKQADFKTVPQIYSPDGSYIGGYEDLVKYLKENQNG